MPSRRRRSADRVRTLAAAPPEPAGLLHSDSPPAGAPSADAGSAGAGSAGGRPAGPPPAGAPSADAAPAGGARAGRGRYAPAGQVEGSGGPGLARIGEHAGERSGSGREEAVRLWHVVLSLAGRPAPLAELRRGLEQLAHDHPFLLTGRYAEDHAEIRYWEQARDLHDAAALALRLWGEHKASARLPAWEIVGLEVVDRATYHKRIAEGFGDPPAFLGGVHPY